MPVECAPLGAFLRSRRYRLNSAQAGIRTFPGPRRVPGLRKWELAVLAGLSPDYYSRLEQGRQASIALGLVTPDSAACVYGTVLGETGMADVAATETRRRVMRRARAGLRPEQNATPDED